MTLDRPPRTRTAAALVAGALAAAALAAAALAGGCAPGAAGKKPAVPDAAASPAGAVQLVDVAAEAGLTHRWREQPRPMRNLEAFGTGCAFLDFDGDGWQDILLVDGPHAVLYRNDGAGRFVDVTEQTGLAAVAGDWKGCAVGDYDGDGRPDLLLTGFHCLALLRNVGGERWQDVTAQAGLDRRNRGHWGSSAGFMDLDGSGTLDLVLLNYVVFGPDEPQYCELRPGIRSGCPPHRYRPEFAELWRNAGNGRFEDVTARSGLAETHGKGLVLAFADVNDDGRPDFYIGNDGTPAELMINLGGLRFRNAGIESGAAYGAIPGHALAAMGADWADYDRDGRLDLAVSAFSDEPYAVLRGLGGGLFEHVADSLAVSGPTLKPLGFGTKWLDVDNDGWPDLVFTNGHVYDNASDIDPLSTFRQPLMLFHNQEGRQLLDVVPSLGGDAARPILGRGLATGDFDNDGRIDLLVVDYEGPPLLLHNRGAAGNHWLRFDLRGRRPNTGAYGARVTARHGEQTWIGQVSPASSYLSSSDPRVHFGLGELAGVESVTIRWPSGKETVLRNVHANQTVIVDEDEQAVGG
jgi:enediyne biosynthesis protein E4